MEDLLVNGYKVLDDAIMHGVNSSVYAWNWTTGRTKEELANTFLATGCAVGATGNILYQKIGPLVFLPAYLMLYRSRSTDNKKYGADERAAIESDCKNFEAEEYKRCASFMGPFCLSWGLGERWLSDGINEDPHSQAGGLMNEIGFYLIGTSFYVMRADPLPPRKNALSRAADMIAELFSEQPQAIKAR